MCKSLPHTVTPGLTRSQTLYFPLTRNLGAEPCYQSQWIGFAGRMRNDRLPFHDRNGCHSRVAFFSDASAIHVKRGRGEGSHFHPIRSGARIVRVRPRGQSLT